MTLGGMWRAWRSRLLIILLLGVAGALAVIAFPYVASAYHVEAGGRAAEDALGMADDPSVAVEHLQRAIELMPDNAQAYWLLARIYTAQEDWTAAVKALTQYTEIRPDSPLGHIELAELYEKIEEAMAALDRIDLLPLLAQAEVKAPDVPVDTPYGQPDGPTWQHYVAETTFSLPPGYGNRPTLFMHAPSQVTYTLSLPAQPMALRFDMGMDPQTHNWPGDGVTFEVFVNGERVFLEYVDKMMARAGWHVRTVDLSAWAGTQVALSLSATPGPVADAAGDWAGWGEPRVIDARWPKLEAMAPERRMFEEWEQAGYTPAGFIDTGVAAQKAGRETEALTWYYRATRADQGLGDPWYYVGQWHAQQAQWPEALAAYERALWAQRFERVHPSDPAYLAGVIYHSYLDPVDLDKARSFYDAALTSNDFGSVYRQADCYYRRAAILRAQGRQPDDYVGDLEQAVALNPDHAWAHLMLGVGLYARDGNLEVAAAEIRRSLALSPENPWAFYYLGEMYGKEGRIEQAASLYRRALAARPEFGPAQDALDRLSIP